MYIAKFFEVVFLHKVQTHLTSISHLTSKPTHDASRHPAWWRWWEDECALYQAQEAWPRSPRSVCRRRV